MKKFLKIGGIILGVIVLILFLGPILFEKQLKDLVQKTINENLNAEVAFNDIDLSLFRNFPDATLAIEGLTVVNHAPFEGDTLAVSEEIILQLNINELFNSNPVKIDALEINNTLLKIKVDSLGNNNYDIAIKDTATTAADSKGFQLDVEHYEINESMVSYFDEAANIGLLVEELNHEGTGDFSAEVSTLSTFSTALVSLMVDEVNYLDKNKVQLEADFEMDLENLKYTFLENEALINQLPLTFDGYVQINEDNNEVDLTFKTPTSSFKNFLAVIPEEYSKNIEEVQTSGDFIVNGFIRGIVDETYIPKMEINIASQNAAFKYPDLPKAVEDITIAAEVVNETGLVEDTYVNIDALNFRIDEDAFRANGSIRNLTGNMLVDMALKGKINLANIEQAYPLELEQDLNGLVTADVQTSFDMNSLETEQYQNIKSSGMATIQNFGYVSPEIPNEVKIATALLKFNSGDISLENMLATTGETDLAINGTIQNLLGFLFTDQKLKGNFRAHSDTFSVNDFMVKEIPAEGEAVAENEVPEVISPEDAIRIPSFLDADLAFTADNVLYDNLALENAAGTVRIENETAKLDGIKANIFGGDILLNGTVSTLGEQPDFTMQLNLNKIDIARSFRDMELLRNLAPIAQALSGSLTTEIDLRGDLNLDLTPQLNTLVGDALAQILGAELVPEQSLLLERLDERLDFIDLSELDISDLSTYLEFKNGQVVVQPFDFEVEGIQGKVSGSHGFDMEMDYKLALQVPAKLFGSQIGSALSRLTAAEQETMTVALPIGITGTFQSPDIDLNMKQAMNNLTQSIIATQKEKLKEKGKNILTDILTEGASRDTTRIKAPGTRTDSMPTKPKDVAKEAAREILGGILGGGKQKKDTTVNQ